MATDVTQFNSWVIHLQKMARGEVSAPDPDAFYIILTNGLTITRTTSLATIAANEVSVTDYARTPADLISAGAVTYNNSTNRAESPPLNLNLTAGAASIQYDGIVLLANALSTPGDSTGNERWFYNTTLTTIPAGGTQTLVIENDGTANIGTASGT